MTVDALAVAVMEVHGTERGLGDSVVARLLCPGAVRPVFQPIVRLADGEVVGYEALARANVPVPGTTSDWFEEADALGLTGELDLACLIAVAEAGPPPLGRLLFVNASPSSLGDPRVQALADRLPGHLVIELTERAAIEDIEGLQADLAWWTGRGARVALDDMGAGYASLQQVVQVRPTFLKLDRSLITGIDTDRTRQALVASLVTFAQQVGASLVAEGVETTRQLAWLREAGVALAQGYLLARPGPRWPILTTTPRSSDERSDLSALERNLASCRTRRAACDAVAEHLFRRGGLMPSVYLQSGGRLRCYAQRGLWQVLDGMAASAGITGRTYRSGRTQIVVDVSAERDYLEAIPGVVAELCVPVRCEGAVVGALNVESLTKLGEDVLAEVEQCAELLGRCLDEHADDEDGQILRRLATVASSLVAVADATETASAVVAAACELAATDSGAVFLGDADQGFTVTHAAGPLERALRAMGPHDLEHLARLLAPLTSAYSSGEATGLGFVGGATLRSAGAQAVIALPLTARGRRLGILLLAHSLPLGIGPVVAEALEVLASVAGTSLETANDLVELRTRASRDALTGLRNHARFHEELRHRHGDPVCITLFDIDRFKEVNDTRGHLAGDRVLEQVAEALLQARPAGSMLFRIGGDEIAALLPTDDVDAAATMAMAMIQATRATLHPVGADLSAGTAVRVDVEDLLDTLHRADAALYRAKSLGGGVAAVG